MLKVEYFHFRRAHVKMPVLVCKSSLLISRKMTEKSSREHLSGRAAFMAQTQKNDAHIVL